MWPDFKRCWLIINTLMYRTYRYSTLLKIWTLFKRKHLIYSPIMHLKVGGSITSCLMVSFGNVSITARRVSSHALLTPVRCRQTQYYVMRQFYETTSGMMHSFLQSAISLMLQQQWKRHTFYLFAFTHLKSRFWPEFFVRRQENYPMISFRKRSVISLLNLTFLFSLQKIFYFPVLCK